MVKLEPATTETSGRVQVAGTHLNIILILSDCVGEILSVIGSSA